MKGNTMIQPRLLAASLVLIGGLLVGLTGCEVDSASDVQRNVGVNYTGFYQNGDSVIVSRNTGASITTLDLRQTGDRLEAVDNNGSIFKGSIGGVNESEDGNLIASFSMEGNTTAGSRGTFSGTLSTSGGSNEAGVAVGLMTGTWIEDTLYGTFTARARIPGAASGGGGGSDLTIAGPSTISIGSSGTFTATGGSGTKRWTISSSVATLSSTSGDTITVTRNSSGTFTLTVNDDAGSDSVSVN